MLRLSARDGGDLRIMAVSDGSWMPPELVKGSKLIEFLVNQNDFFLLFPMNKYCNQILALTAIRCRG